MGTPPGRTIVRLPLVDDDAWMPAEEPDDRTAVEPGDVAGERKKRRNPWVLISALLLVVAAGLLIWALAAESDNDSTQEQLASTQEELASTQEQLDGTQEELDSAKQDVEELQSSEGGPGDGRAVLTAGAVAAVKALIDDLEAELGATEEDLAAAEQDLKQASAKADAADEDAAAAEEKAAQASNDTEKAQAEADQAKAEAEAAQSRSAIAADCARAYVAALGTLFEGDDVSKQVDAVGEQLSGITAECKAALAGT